MWNLAFFLIRPPLSADISGVNSSIFKMADNMTDEMLKSKPSDEISPERLAQSGAAVADLAHLAKNLLQVLSGCGEIIDLAMKTNQFDRVRQAWQLHQPCFQRLKKFQLDLIKYTKSYPLNIEPCNLSSVLASASKQLGPFFAKRSVRFSFTGADTPATVNADSEKLRDAVVNLLITAVDNLQDEPGQITLEISLSDTGDAILITVSDTGPRLDDEACNDLLSPLERCRNMLGTGLEIPLAKQIIEAHHGTLTINTGANPCNTLTLTLPVT